MQCPNYTGNMSNNNIVINSLKKIRSRFKQLVRKYNAVVYPIIKEPKKFFEVVAVVKEESWEKAYYAECYGHNKEQQLEVLSPEDIIFKIKDGIVIEGSDVLVTEQGVYWGKYNQEEFTTFLIPLDDNVIWYNRDHIKLDKFESVEYVSGRVLPLIGHDAHHWVHSIYEFLPRLFSAGEAGILETPITILVIENIDHNIDEIINRYLINFPAAKIKKVKDKVAYKCEELYFQPVVGPSCSGYKFRLDYPWYIPRYIVDQVNRYIVEPVIERVNNKTTSFDKIFLGRSSKFTKNARTLLNYDEVHDFFLSRGFVDIEGSTLTLEEKANIFYHAKEIVALIGSSNMNMAFCNQAKCMVLGNYRFATEPVIYPFIREKVSSYVYVTGQDEHSGFHSSYYIPLEKIKKVYQERMA